tara:strand:+ start:1045 stop:1257 length:213 start_codon:yes stop_codon:yes gene_type:complete
MIIFLYSKLQMPFSIRGNKKDGFRLYNLEKKTFAKRTFKTRQAAENMKKVYMSYDKKKTPDKKKKSTYGK